MQNLRNRDYSKRFNFLKMEKLIFVYNAVLCSDTFDSITKAKASFLLQSFGHNCFKSALHNFCIDSGRSHGVYRLFGLSRIKMRELLHLGKLSGFRKSHW